MSEDPQEKPRRIELPSEIWARIAECCSLLPKLHDATTALRALCLVCSDTHRCALPVLYARPALYNERKQTLFWETVCARPNLWYLVKSILLGRRDWLYGDGPTFGQSDEDWQKYRNSAQWAANLSSEPPPIPRLNTLGDALAMGDSAGARWAEQFRLVSPNLPVSAGAGPSPAFLEEVAWWEAGGGGGLLTGHCYSTAPVGDWCKGVLNDRVQAQARRARTTEDVDMGRGPGQPLQLSWYDGRRRHEEIASRANEQAASTSAGPTGLSEDDVWAAAERMALVEPSPEHKAPRGTRHSRVGIEALRSAWTPPPIRQGKHRQQRVPWRYRLIIGWFNSGVGKFFEAIGTLVHIELFLYLGTYLDYDLLEHQLRVILDTDRLPLLRQLDIRVGHDATSAGNKSHPARRAYLQIVSLAVKRIDDPRCRLVATAAELTSPTDSKESLWRQREQRVQDETTASLVDVPTAVKTRWHRDVDDSQTPANFHGVSPAGKTKPKQLGDGDEAPWDE